MKPQRRLRLGMVGGGEGAFIGAVHRLAARMDDRYELVAGAFSSSVENCQRTGEALWLDPARCYASYQKMAAQEAAREDGIDVVAIVTPNFLHAPVATAFLQAGIHVICDKPLCLNSQQAAQLAAVVKQSQCQFILTHNYSAYPLIREARQRIMNGELGEIRFVEVEYLQDWMSELVEHSDNKQASWRGEPAKAGAGCIGDVGTHAWQLASFVSGMMPQSLSAELATLVAGRTLDDDVRVTLRYANGARGRLWASQVASGHENSLRLRVYGSEASLEFQQEDPNKLWIRPRNAPAYCLTRGSNALSDDVRTMSRVPAGHPEGYLEGFGQLYREAADQIWAAIEGQPFTGSLLPGIDDGVAGMKFIDAVRQSSAEDGKWVAFGAG